MRSYLAALALVAYAGAAVLRAAAAPSWALGLLGVPALVLALVWRATALRDTAPAEQARRPIVAAARASATGVVVLALGVFVPHLAASKAALAFGAGLASLAGMTALVQAGGRTGIVPPRALPATQATVLAGLSFGAAFVLAARTALLELPPIVLPGDRPADSYALSASGLGALGLFVALAIQAQRARRLELGAPERLRSFAWLAGTMTAVAAGLGALGLAPVDVVLPVAAGLTGAVASTVATARDPAALGRLSGRVLAVAVLAGPPALGAGAMLRVLPWAAVEISVLGAALSSLGGLFAARLASGVSPSHGTWLRTLESATASSRRPDPDETIERALFELRALSDDGGPPPFLVRLAPAMTITVDRAGYAQTQPATIPPHIAEVAAEEPERVLRREVLEEATVRRADARPALAWMTERELGAVALLEDGDLPIGLLCLPLPAQEHAATLAEMKSLRALADQIAAALAASSRIARALEREEELRRAAARIEERFAALESELESDRDRTEALTRTLAERADRAVYSPAARAAAEAITRIAKRREPLALIVPPGVDPLPFAARYHLGTDRRGGGLHCHDGSDPNLADLELWRSQDRSPLVRARGGTLLLASPERLPQPVQSYIGVATTDRLGLVVLVPRTVDTLVATGELDERLADLLGDRAVALPPLSARAEDLRALVGDALVRAGLAYRGRPLGIEPAALALVVEHPWPGNDLELESLLLRAALTAEGEVVTRADLARAGLVAPAPAPSPARRARARSIE